MSRVNSLLEEVEQQGLVFNKNKLKGEDKMRNE